MAVRAKKSRQPKAHKLAEQFPNGETLRDLCKKDWVLGDVIGQGGFGQIYLASDKVGAKVGPTAEYVVKIEPKANGPLFVELNFYQRVTKPDQVDGWQKSQKLKYLGVPKYIASGQHTYKGATYRFMVMQRFSTDLQKLFENSGKLFSRQSVFALALRIIDALEYLHVSKYVHADIKASNCLLGYQNGKTTPDMVYVVDYGLATKYVIEDEHRVYKEDPKKAHDGTIEFTSIDAHKGVALSRRGDLEILGYCLLQWLCSRLPWEDKLSDCNYVMQSKIKHMNDIPSLMKKSFPGGDIPGEITTYLTLVKALRYDETPNYNKLRDIFHKGLTKIGVKDSWKLGLPLTGKPSSPVKGTKRKLAEPSTSEPKPKAKPAKRTKPATPKPKSPKKPATPRVKSPEPKSKTPSSKPARVKSPKARAKPATPRVKSPKSQSTVEPSTSKTNGAPAGFRSRDQMKKMAIDEKGAASPVGSRKRKVTSPNGVAAVPVKRKMKRKLVQMSEMAVQTSPGLKKNR